jgi:hypothetical protein
MRDLFSKLPGATQLIEIKENQAYALWIRILKDRVKKNPLVSS